jgi:RsiW-degrading membrane proteinase PrsW (M82 family)
MIYYGLLLGLPPAIFFAWYIYKKDKWQPEPKDLVIGTFRSCFSMVILAGIIEKVICIFFFPKTNNNEIIPWLIEFFIIVGPIEELFKYAVVRYGAYKTEYFDEKIDGVVYMSASAMGFAGFENAMYIASSAAPNTVALLRSVTSTPAHLIFSGFLGLFLGSAYICNKNGENGKAKLLIFIGFIVASLLHGLYDIIATLSDVRYQLGGIALFILFFGGILIYRVEALAHESKLELESNPKAHKTTSEKKSNSKADKTTSEKKKKSNK